MARDKYERTPLHLAAADYAPNGELCRLLLKAGADPNARDEEGHTPLQLIRYDEVRQVLLDAGAQPMDPLPDQCDDLEAD